MSNLRGWRSEQNDEDHIVSNNSCIHHPKINYFLEISLVNDVDHRTDKSAANKLSMRLDRLI